jgi:hypothetical protein
LEHALRTQPATEQVVKVVERVEVPVLDPAVVDRLSATAHALAEVGTELGAMADALLQALARASSMQPPPDRMSPPLSAERPTVPRLRSVRPAASSIEEREPKLPLAERKILTALAQYPRGRTKQQVALLTGYAVTGGGFNNALGALRSKGWIAGQKEHLQLTNAGRDALGAWEPLPTGRALADHWIAHLPKAERSILEVLLEAYPGSLTKQETATVAGYEPTGGGFNNALGRLRTLELIEGRSELRASETFFEDSGDTRQFG